MSSPFEQASLAAAAAAAGGGEEGKERSAQEREKSVNTAVTPAVCL